MPVVCVHIHLFSSLVHLLLVELIMSLQFRYYYHETQRPVSLVVLQLLLLLCIGKRDNDLKKTNTATTAVVVARLLGTSILFITVIHHFSLVHFSVYREGKE